MAKRNGDPKTPQSPWPSNILPAPSHPKSGKSRRVRAIDLASTFKLPEEQIQLALVRGCAQGNIASWAGQAFFIEGDISHREVDWPIPREAWVSRNDPSSSNTTQDDGNPVFSLRDGTLRGRGFSPVVLEVPYARIVEISSIEFQLSRIEFDGDDLGYHIQGLGNPTPERRKCPPKGTLPPRATPGDRRNEKAAHDAVAFVRRGMSVSAAIREVMDQVDAENRNPDSVSRGIRQAYNLMYDRNGNLHTG